MNENNYKAMPELPPRALSDFPLFKLPQDTINALVKSAHAMSSVMYPDDFTDRLAELATTLSTLSKTTLPNIESITASSDSLDFSPNTDFQNQSIELTESDCAKINTFLESSNIKSNSPKVSKGKISLRDFIKTVLLPILAIILPMIQNCYNNKINSIESQKAHMEELQLQEQKLRIAEQQLQNDIEQKQLLENILTELQYFPEYFESLPEVLECPDEAQKPFAEVPDFPADTQDNDLSNPDVSNNPETDIHKEQ